MKMTKSAFARHRKCNPSFISKLLKRKIIEADEVGLIDVEEADRKIAVSRARADSPVPRLDVKSEDGARILAARARSEEHKAGILELEHGRLAGTLVLASEVRAAAGSSARQARNAMLAIPDRLAPLLAAESDQFRVHALLRDEITRALHALADSMEPQGDPK